MNSKLYLTCGKHLLMAMLIAAFWTDARGQTNSWTAGSGNWENGADWSSGGPPFNGEDVFITNSASKTVTIDTNTTSDSAFSLTIGSLRLAAPGSATNTLKVINADSFPFLMNTLLVGAGGSMFVSNTVLGVAISNTISNGHMVVLNTTSFPSTLGSSNFAFLVTGSSATFSNSGPAAFENVRGNSVVVTNGGRVDTDDLYVGFKLSNVLMRADSNAFTVTGTNSQFNAHILSIGEVGSSNKFSIGNGATMRIKSALRLSSTANTLSNLMQVLTGGTLIVGDNVFVANTNSTAAAMNIAGGLSTLASNLITASFANSTSAVNITGGQLTVTNGVIGIGNSGTVANGSGAGRLTVSNGTLMTSRVVLGNSAGTRCDLIVADGGVISDGGCPGGTNCLMVINSLGFSDTNGTVNLCATPVQIGVTGPADGTVSGGTASYQYLYTGYSNIGTFTLAGGTVSICAQFDVGHFGLDDAAVVATGAVWVTGGQLTMDSDDSIIGNSGVGQMSISNGVVMAAKVTVGNSTNASSFGTLTLAGGALTATSLVLPNTHSRFIFTGGQLSALGITNANGQMLTLGNGTSPITLNLLGGVSSFGAGLKISTNATVSGFGTITGTVVSFGLISPSGGTLTFTGGDLTNNGMIRVVGTVIEAYGTVVNNGTIDAINGGTNFHSGFINHGTVIDAHSVRISSTTISSNNNVIVQIPSVSGHTYQLQTGSSITASNWTNSGVFQGGTGGMLTFIDPSGATNNPARFYRIDVTAP